MKAIGLCGLAPLLRLLPLALAACATSAQADLRNVWAADGGVGPGAAEELRAGVRRGERWAPVNSRLFRWRGPARCSRNEDGSRWPRST